MPALELSRSDRKRQAIMAAATSLFLSRGYDGTSMDDVAGLAEVSKPTVYKHFADKQGLFYAIVLATTDQMNDMVFLGDDSGADADRLRENLTLFARRFLGALMQPEVLRLRRLVIANAERFPEMGRTWYERGFGRALDSLAAELQRLSEAGLLEVEDAHLAANHFVGLLLWIPLNQVMFTGEMESTSEAKLNGYATAAVQAFLRAYGPRDARSADASHR